MGGPGLCPTTPHPITGETVPLTFGHEFSGTIEEVGEGVDDWVVGDRVSVQPIIYDGTCGACQDNLHNCCWSNGFIGLSGIRSTGCLILELWLTLVGWGGGLSEHIVVPTSALYRLPKNVPMQIGGEEP